MLIAQAEVEKPFIVSQEKSWTGTAYDERGDSTG
jgi:hypothetical protein